jgi:hypothetical protein
MFAPSKGKKCACGAATRRNRVRPGAGVRRRSGEKLEIYVVYRRKAGAGSTTGATWVPKCLTNK